MTRSQQKEKEEQAAEYIVKVLKSHAYLKYLDVLKRDIEIDGETYRPWTVSEMIQEYADDDNIDRYSKLINEVCYIEATDEDYLNNTE